MKKDFRIRKRRDFINVSRSGLYFRTDSVIAQCHTNNLETFRIGFTASKKVGNAVVRNRCKRRMRAAADLVLQKIGMSGVDYVFIARQPLPNVDWKILINNATQAVTALNSKILKCKKF